MSFVSTTSRWSWRAAAVALTIALGAACSSSTSTSGSTAPGSTTTLPAFVKVGPNPSISSKMVCGTEGQASIAAALNATPTNVTNPTWVHDLYSCTYVYATGTMNLSVRELSTAAQTTTYFDQLQHTYGVHEKFALASGAFVSPAGIVVARKDYKVLTVDPTKLPAQFGKPPTSRSNVSVETASALMGCWTGA
jgi:hypothetical protein